MCDVPPRDGRWRALERPAKHRVLSDCARFGTRKGGFREFGTGTHEPWPWTTRASQRSTSQSSIADRAASPAVHRATCANGRRRCWGGDTIAGTRSRPNYCSLRHYQRSGVGNWNRPTICGVKARYPGTSPGAAERSCLGVASFVTGIRGTRVWRMICAASSP